MSYLNVVHNLNWPLSRSWLLEYYIWYYKVSGLCPLFCIKGATHFKIRTISIIGQYLRVALSIWYTGVGVIPPFHQKRGTDPLYEICSVLNLKTVHEVQKPINLCKYFFVEWNNLTWVIKVKVSTHGFDAALQNSYNAWPSHVKMTQKAVYTKLTEIIHISKLK